jgi:hypothetical protein
VSNPPTVPEADAPGDAVPSRRELAVTVYDEDAGTTFHLSAPPSATVGHVVTTFYRDDLRRDRDPTDRLRCEANGDNVFAREAEHLEAYSQHTCHELKWVFTGGTGGA